MSRSEPGAATCPPNRPHTPWPQPDPAQPDPTRKGINTIFQPKSRNRDSDRKPRLRTKPRLSLSRKEKTSIFFSRLAFIICWKTKLKGLSQFYPKYHHPKYIDPTLVNIVDSHDHIKLLALFFLLSLFCRCDSAFSIGAMKKTITLQCLN